MGQFPVSRHLHTAHLSFSVSLHVGLGELHRLPPPVGLEHRYPVSSARDSRQRQLQISGAPRQLFLNWTRSKRGVS
jgi:hypothetical protein